MYLPVEGPTSDLYGGERPGNNLFGNTPGRDRREDGAASRGTSSSCITTSGTTTTPRRRSCSTSKVDGKPIKAVVQLTKQAFAYAFDRATGEPRVADRGTARADVRRARRVDVADAAVPDEAASAYDRQGVSEDDLVDFTPEIKARGARRPSKICAWGRCTRRRR